MSSDFQIVALAREHFEHLFSLSDAELATQGIRRMIVDKNPGYPCRVSLQDAPIGERVLLAPFKHHDVDSAYQSAGPIFAREKAEPAKLRINEIPLMLKHRLLSVRGYDEGAMMKATRVVEGKSLAETIGELFADEDISYLQVHNAGPGCFNCEVRRA
jgi:Protein of unknown function (DUF1203)